jgi:hypothetical protein
LSRTCQVQGLGGDEKFAGIAFWFLEGTRTYCPPLGIFSFPPLMVLEKFAGIAFWFLEGAGTYRPTLGLFSFLALIVLERINCQRLNPIMGPEYPSDKFIYLA